MTAHVSCVTLNSSYYCACKTSTLTTHSHTDPQTPARKVQPKYPTTDHHTYDGYKHKKSTILPTRREDSLEPPLEVLPYTRKASEALSLPPTNPLARVHPGDRCRNRCKKTNTRGKVQAAKKCLPEALGPPVITLHPSARVPAGEQVRENHPRGGRATARVPTAAGVISTLALRRPWLRWRSARAACHVRGRRASRPSVPRGSELAHRVSGAVRLPPCTAIQVRR